MANNHIIQKAARGDHQSMRQLYDQNVESVFASSFRITNDIQASEDIIQESFLTSFSKLNMLADANKYQGWLRKIVINNSLAYMRKKKIFYEINHNQVSTKEDDDDEDWYSGITFDVIQEAIQKLPAGARTIFSLYALEGYKHREIAEMQSITQATSKTQFRYAKKLLKASLLKLAKDEI